MRIGRRTKTHENTVYFASIRQQAFPEVAPEILLKELFEPQAALLFTAFRHFAPKFVLDARKGPLNPSQKRSIDRQLENRYCFRERREWPIRVP
jgi:hypothetical protein